MSSFLIGIALAVPSLSICFVAWVFLRALHRTQELQRDMVRSLAIFIKSPDVQTAVSSDTIRLYNEKLVQDNPAVSNDLTEEEPPPTEIQLEDGKYMDVQIKGEDMYFEDKTTGERFERIW